MHRLWLETTSPAQDGSACIPSFTGFTSADWEEGAELHPSLFMSLSCTEADVMMLVFIVSISNEWHSACFVWFSLPAKIQAAILSWLPDLCFQMMTLFFFDLAARHNIIVGWELQETLRSQQVFPAGNMKVTTVKWFNSMLKPGSQSEFQNKPTVVCLLQWAVL